MRQPSAKATHEARATYKPYPPMTGRATPNAPSKARIKRTSEMPYVSGAQHRLVEIDRFAGELLQLLDGSNTREKLSAVIVEKIASGELSAETKEGITLEDEKEIEATASRQVDILFSQFAANGLISS
ncbi:hypothetical protein N9Z18_02415 [Verrucomicrobiales bacterium]|jgi:methyltransferase-like protein|nr:hypothetical protein [Verrucomicrobiales bacterium]MDB4359075.1 hypothetical protein [Verrucomicrobiales bacterium]